MAVAVGGAGQTPALEAVDHELASLAKGDIGRLMVFIAPQEGKSSRVSCWYPLWRLAQDPTLRIAIVSYAGNKAERWGRWLRRRIINHPELGIKLMTDSRAVDRFETTAGGSVVCVGIEGGITGEPVDEMIIDDPVRGRAEAESATYRRQAWEWWESNGATRLSERGRVVLMMTRWHADDLAGRLLANEGNEWRVLRIPAIKDPDIDVFSPDGKSAYNDNGELISVRGRATGYFYNLRVKRSAYVWRSVYAQTPVAAEGNLFNRADFRYWIPTSATRQVHLPLRGQRGFLEDRLIMWDDCYRFMTVDLAASTKTSSDWSVAAVWALTPDGHLCLLDLVRERSEESGHWSLIRPLVERWQVPDVFVEKGFIGSTLMIDATRAGTRVQPVSPDKDKLTRALPAVHRVRAHTVWFGADTPYLDDLCDELAAFPAAAHDDQVDVLSYAARIVSAHWNPPSNPRRTQPAPDDPGQVAYEAATGLFTVDLDQASW